MACRSAADGLSLALTCISTYSTGTWLRFRNHTTTLRFSPSKSSPPSFLPSFSSHSADNSSRGAGGTTPMQPRFCGGGSGALGGEAEAGGR